MNDDTDNQEMSVLGRASPWIALAVTLLVYAGAWQAGLVLDDRAQVMDAAYLRGPAPLADLWTTPDRSLVRLTFWLNHALDGLNPRGYHAFNVLLHWLAGCVLLSIVRRSLPRVTRVSPGLRADAIALVIALAWLLHPLQTQAAVYVTQRAEQMAALCYLLVLDGVLRVGTGRRPIVGSAIAVAACLLGWLCKVVIVTAPLVALMFDAVFVAKSCREALRRRWALHLTLAATWLMLFPLGHFTWLIPQRDGPLPPVVTAAASTPHRDAIMILPPLLPGPGGAARPPTPVAGFEIQSLPARHYLLCQAVVVLHYLKLTVWPARLNLDYGWRSVDVLARAGPAVVMMVVLTVLSAWGLVRRHPLEFCGFAALLILAPTSSVVPLVDLVMEHRMLLPLAPLLAGAISVSALLLWRWPRASIAIAVAVLAALGWRTTQRVSDYRDERTMWTAVVRAGADHPRALLNLGAARFEAGDVNGAITVLQRAAMKWPMLPEVKQNLAVALLRRGGPGDMDEALRQLGRLLRLDPDNTLALRLAGEAAFERQQVDNARHWLERYVQRKPDDAGALERLARLAIHRDDQPAAMELLTQAVRLAPDRTGLYQAATILARRMARTGHSGDARQWLARFGDLAGNAGAAAAALKSLDDASSQLETVDSSSNPE